MKVLMFLRTLTHRETLCNTHTHMNIYRYITYVDDSATACKSV